MTAFYNEIDPYAVQWLRNLIKAGEIADGVVDERDIRDIRPDELVGYTQCHFFAGIGGWSLALRLAGIPDDYPIWTGSCPCQPFSSAGKGEGFADERHLWPDFFHLISQCRPASIVGEQVASKATDPWLDLVRADLEALGYAFGAVAVPAAGCGAPHIRDRTWWVAHASSQGLSEQRRQRDESKRFAETGMAGRLADYAEPGRQSWRRAGEACDGRNAARIEPGRLCDAGGLADSDISTGGQGSSDICRRIDGSDAQPRPGFGGSGLSGGLADADSVGAQRQRGDASEAARLSQEKREPEHDPDVFERGRADCDGRNFVRGNGLHENKIRPRPLHGFWRAADWLLCRDGKFRPVEPGTFPLAHGVPARVGRLRAYGNAIVPQVAAEFIRSVM